MKTIFAYCDSLCEPNPGHMEGGFWAKDEEDNLLFSCSISLGHGTCNEAEYYAIMATINKIKELVKGKEMPRIVIHSDSQLSTKQLNGLWKVTKQEMKLLYQKVENLRKEIPFEIRWIPREQNAIADGLAQEKRLKGSSRNYLMDDGRFRVKRYTPCVELLGDKQMAILLYSKELVAMKKELLEIVDQETLDFQKVVSVVNRMLAVNRRMKVKLPKINSLADNWISSTFDIMDGKFSEFISQAMKGDRKTLKTNVILFFDSITKEENEADYSPEEEKRELINEELEQWYNVAKPKYTQNLKR